MIFVVALASLTYAALALLGFLRLRAPRLAPPAAPPPVSVLKPLCGADDELEGCLASYFQQDHPEFELLFGVERADDPALPVVRALMARYPHVPARVVVHDRPRATNPKVSNLLGLWPYARHERVLISDANTRAPRALLRSLAASMRDDVGLVSSPIAGTGEATVGAALECATLCGFVAAGVVVPALGRDPVVVGKSMMLRKSALERLGGLASVADVLAEDYLLGKVLQHGGWRVVLDPTVVENVCRTTTLRAFAARQLRWSMLRMRLHPVAFALEPLTSPLAVVPAAWWWGGAPGAALGYVLVVLLRDGAGWWRLRGPSRWWIPLLSSPVREVLMLGLWAATPWLKRVSWRGHSVRLGTGTRVFVEDPERPSEAARAPARRGC